MELGCQLPEFGIARVKRPEVRQGIGMLFDRYIVQLAAALPTPRLPGGEEIQPEAEARFQDDEALTPGPSLRKAIAGEEDVARLRRAAGGAVVHVPKRFRPGRAFLEMQRRGLDPGSHRPSI